MFDDQHCAVTGKHKHIQHEEISCMENASHTVDDRHSKNLPMSDFFFVFGAGVLEMTWINQHKGCTYSSF